MAIWPYLHLSISTALMRPRRPKKYCLQLVIYIYIYIYKYINIYIYCRDESIVSLVFPYLNIYVYMLHTYIHIY